MNIIDLYMLVWDNQDILLHRAFKNSFSQEEQGSLLYMGSQVNE